MLLGVPYAHVSQRRRRVFNKCPDCGCTVGVSRAAFMPGGRQQGQAFVDHWLAAHSSQHLGPVPR